MTFKNQLRLKAWANYQAEQDGTRTLEGANKWKKDAKYRIDLYKKWEDIALEKQEEILSAY